MNRIRWLVLPMLLAAAGTASAQDAATAWNAVAQPIFDATKSAPVDNIQIARDRMHITLVNGTIQFAQPAHGLVFAAAFRGQGRIQIDPPNDLEKQQLQLLAKTDTINLDFTEATFSFTDGFFDEIARQVQWGPAPSSSLGQTYVKRQNEREDIAAALVPRIFQGVFSGDHSRTAYFAADVKSTGGWVLARYDALDPEEISIGRWTSWGSYEGFDTWMHFPAGNRSSNDAFANPFAKELFLTRGYKIDATVTTGADLASTTQMRFEERASGERVIVVDLDANLRVDSVKNAQGKPLSFFQPREPKDRFPTYGDYVAVVLAAPSQAGQTQTLEFHFSGKRVVRKEGEGNYFCRSYGWYPATSDSFASRYDFEMTFHFPKKYVLVATGSLTDDPKDGVSNWKSDIPLAVAGFAFGDYKEYKQSVNSVDVDVYVNRNPDEFLSFVQHVTNPNAPGSNTPGFMPLGTLDPTATIKQMNTEIANSLKLFQDYFGPYPYKHLAVTNIPYSYGQGWPGLLYLSVLSFLDSTQRHALGISDQIGVSDFFRAHETSHQWWGHRVGWKSYHDQWLSEGFAQFSGNLYVQFRENPAEYIKRLRIDRDDLFNKNRYGHVYESLGPIWMGDRLSSSQGPDGYNRVIYEKGGYILHMLRMMLNDSSNTDPDHFFKDTMRDFTQTFDNRAASTEDFKAIVEKHMLPAMAAEGKHNMDWFFREYVYGTGVPHYEYDTEIREQKGKWMVTGTITRTGVPDNWIDILPVYVHAQKRVVRLGWIRVTGKSTPLQFGLPAKPDKIVLNEDEDILAIMKQK